RPPRAAPGPAVRLPRWGPRCQPFAPAFLLGRALAAGYSIFGAGVTGRKAFIGSFIDLVPFARAVLHGIGARITHLHRRILGAGLAAVAHGRSGFIFGFVLLCHRRTHVSRLYNTQEAVRLQGMESNCRLW